ncbi:MAG: hypothetical protein MI920_31620 [Kiloniellales bacterium]|nr:hypothetical protein [Kiloniellales bacterium]
MTERQEGQIDDANVDEVAAAEAKRLAARRRFLLGGAAAVPLVVTASYSTAFAGSNKVRVGPSVCATLGGKVKYYKTKTTVICRSGGHGGGHGDGDGDGDGD